MEYKLILIEHAILFPQTLHNNNNIKKHIQYNQATDSTVRFFFFIVLHVYVVVISSTWLSCWSRNYRIREEFSTWCPRSNDCILSCFKEIRTNHPNYDRRFTRIFGDHFPSKDDIIFEVVRWKIKHSSSNTTFKSTSLRNTLKLCGRMIWKTINTNTVKNISKLKTAKIVETETQRTWIKKNYMPIYDYNIKLAIYKQINSPNYMYQI